jgi:hypothetical protein
MIGVMTTSLLAGCQNALELSFELLARALDELQLLLVLACLKEGDGSGEHDAERCVRNRHMAKRQYDVRKMTSAKEGVNLRSLGRQEQRCLSRNKRQTSYKQVINSTRTGRKRRFSGQNEKREKREKRKRKGVLLASMERRSVSRRSISSHLAFIAANWVSRSFFSSVRVKISFSMSALPCSACEWW